MEQVTTPKSVNIPVLKQHVTQEGPISPDDILEYIQIPIPGGHWHLTTGEDGFCLVNQMLRQSVICSACVEEDGKRWIHLSIASQERMPTYEDLCWLKRTFLGEEGKAVLVFPPKSVHVNLHPRALHLFSTLDTDPLPEFSGFHPGAGGRRSI